MYRIRIDEKSGLDVRGFIQATGATTYVLVHHVLPHGNPHYHAYLECPLKENTLRQRIKRLELSSSDFSIKKCDPTRKNEYIQYLFNQKHGNIATIDSTYNFDDNLLAELQAKAQLIADEYQTEQNNRRNNKPTVYELSQEVSQIYESRYSSTISDLGRWKNAPEGAQEYEEHLIIAIQVCRKYKQPFEENYLRRLVTTAICNRDSGQRTVVANIMDRVFSRR